MLWAYVFHFRSCCIDLSLAEVDFRIILPKKIPFFPLKGKQLTCSHFVQKLAQIVGYGQTIIGIVQRKPRRWFSIPITIPERVQMKKSILMKKKFQIFFLTNFLKGYFKAFPEKPFFQQIKTIFSFFCRKFGLTLKNCQTLFLIEKTGKS